MDLEELSRLGYVQKITPSKELAEKEFNEAEYDLERAEKALAEKDYKWATVKAYYAAFHSAKGVLFLAGIKEKAHFAVAEVLEILSREGKLESRFVTDFKAALSARQAADYQYDYSERTAEDMVSLAGDFVERMKKLRETI
jgi:uncharacterized protein (UPF0332 family)